MAFKSLFNLLMKNKKDILLLVLFIFAMGELWLRAPYILHRIEYQPDKDFGAILKPGQKGFSWLAEMSLKSPPITINSDGYRGKEIDWSKPAILAVGASDTFGSSVSDYDVWTNKLENGLRATELSTNISVINAGHPGHGPSHHFVRIRRFLEKKTPELIIIRIGIGMRLFHAPKNDSQKSKEYILAQHRYRIRKFTKFFPFLYNKAKLQRSKIKKALIPFFFRRPVEERREAKASVAEDMWKENREWWRETLSLAEDKNIPVLFCIWDLTGLKSSRIIAKKIDTLCNQYKSAYTLYLGPKTIGIEGIEYKYAHRIFRDKYTLRLDLHGNPAQHQLLADKHIEFIKNKNLLKNI